VYSLVPLLSDLPIITLVLLILSQVPPAFILGIRFVGGFFLLYLTVNIVRMAAALKEEDATEGGEAGVGLFKAVMVNFLNPNPYLYWGVISGPVLVAGWREAPAFGIAMLAGFYATMIVVMAVMIVVISLARRLPILFRKVLLIVSAAGLAFFGVYQIWIGVSALFGSPIG
jgi:threonine/homoserine/homoserine lactone efflux protein